MHFKQIKESLDELIQALNLFNNTPASFYKVSEIAHQSIAIILYYKIKNKQKVPGFLENHCCSQELGEGIKILKHDKPTGFLVLGLGNEKKTILKSQEVVQTHYHFCKTAGQLVFKTQATPYHSDYFFFQIKNNEHKATTIL